MVGPTTVLVGAYGVQHKLIDSSKLYGVLVCSVHSATACVSGVEIGAERAENRVSRSGALSWHRKLRMGARSGDRAEMAARNQSFIYL